MRPSGDDGVLKLAGGGGPGEAFGVGFKGEGDFSGDQGERLTGDLDEIAGGGIPEVIGVAVRAAVVHTIECRRADHCTLVQPVG